MGNILNTKETNINNCNSDSNCYYLGGNCLLNTSSASIKDIDLKCSYTLQNPDSNSSPYELLFGCNYDSTTTNYLKYYIIQSIYYIDAAGMPQYLYKYDPSSSDITSNIIKNTKDKIPFIYNGSIQNISFVYANTDKIDNIHITDIYGDTKKFDLINNIINDNNLQKIIAPDNGTLSQMQTLSAAIIGNVSNSST